MSKRKSKKTASTTLATILFSLVVLIIACVSIWYFVVGSSSSNNKTELNANNTEIAQTTADNATSSKTSSTTSTPTPKPTSNASIKTDGYILENVMPVDGNFNFLMFDIGQGDSLFLKMPNGKVVLIDTGVAEYWDRLDSYLKQLNVEKIDILIATHPHSDHIGSMSKVIENYDIGEIYMPRATHTSKTFLRLMEAIEKKNYTITPLQGADNQTINIDSDVSISVMAPIDDEYESLNNYSAVLHITYQDTTFLLTGDAEKLSENEMVDYYGDKLESDVLKVPHHGSSTSSKKAFLSVVQPKYALISCEQDNKYNHPNEKTVARLEAAGATVYRTDLVGSILVTSDGKNITITTSH